MIALVLPILLQAQASAPPPAKLQNAQVTSRALASGGLREEVETAGRSGAVSWLGYEQDVVDGDRQMCCFQSLRSSRRRDGDRLCCGGCRLEQEGAFSIDSPGDRSVELERSRFFVLIRVAEGGVDRVRALSEDCGIDAGGKPFMWLTGVSPSESLTFLRSLVAPFAKRGYDRNRAGEALAAIAAHAAPAAAGVLMDFLAPGQPIEVRKQAAFWLGNSRGRRGFEALRSSRSDPDPEFRRHLTFCFSQSPVPEAVAELIAMAKEDPDGGVRGQALFWLAQKAADRAAETIQNAIRDDPDEDVKKKAVFALSQLPRDEAVTELIRVARTNRNPEVRRQAIFWLGQSKDPRALAFIEEILDR
ncbi:MAG TPA: HEAT repeat domain-containing protein [Thermoanaerobaculia bacterium]|nr:HEAT repeat domain-containing protein [Thermoanaerobaculia bacterium]